MEEKCLQTGNKLLNRERDVSNPLMYFFNVVDNAAVVRNPGKWRHLTRPRLNPRTSNGVKWTSPIGFSYLKFEAFKQSK